MSRHPKVAPRGLVAVTASTKPDGDVERVRLSTTYTQALERVGLTPLVIPPFDAKDPDEPALTARVQQIMAVVSGLLLTGGEDVDPAFFGAAPSPYLETVHRRRDATEIALLRAAQERTLPTLAICRGIQVLNVAMGGTLIQDIPHERSGALNHSPPDSRAKRTHGLHVQTPSRLAQALKGTTFAVNSVHHQAVDRLAPGFRTVAVAPDDIIEGIELPMSDPWWVLGVQWHPEEFIQVPDAPDIGLFAAFHDAIDAERPSLQNA